MEKVDEWKTVAATTTREIGRKRDSLTVGPSWRLWSVDLEVESSSILREYYDLYFHTLDVLRLSIVNIIRVSF